MLNWSETLYQAQANRPGFETVSQQQAVLTCSTKTLLDSCRVLLEHAKIEQVEESLSYIKDTKLVYSKEPKSVTSFN